MIVCWQCPQMTAAIVYGHGGNQTVFWCFVLISAHHPQQWYFPHRLPNQISDAFSLLFYVFMKDKTKLNEIVFHLYFTNHLYEMQGGYPGIQS